MPYSGCTAMSVKMCPACGASSAGPVRNVPDYEYRVHDKACYVDCGQCRTVFQTPMPVFAELSASYPAHYHSQSNQGVVNRIRNRMRLDRLKSLIRPGGTVLDYGCGNGSFIRYASRMMPSCKFFGYEIGATRQVRKLGDSVTLIEGAPEEAHPILPACDLITMNHVVEHLPDPLAVVTDLFEKLTPGGVLEGQTPAAGSLEHRVFKAYWSGYHAPRHTVVFSPKGLELILRKAGFADTRTSFTFNPASLAVSLASVVRGRKPAKGIDRRGMGWLCWLAAASLMAPIDLFSGAPAIMNFTARKSGAQPAGTSRS